MYDYTKLRSINSRLLNLLDVEDVQNLMTIYQENGWDIPGPEGEHIWTYPNFNVCIWTDDDAIHADIEFRKVFQE